MLTSEVSMGFVNDMQSMFHSDAAVISAMWQGASTAAISQQFQDEMSIGFVNNVEWMIHTEAAAMAAMWQECPGAWAPQQQFQPQVSIGCMNDIQPTICSDAAATPAHWQGGFGGGNDFGSDLQGPQNLRDLQGLQNPPGLGGKDSATDLQDTSAIRRRRQQPAQRAGKGARNGARERDTHKDTGRVLQHHKQDVQGSRASAAQVRLNGCICRTADNGGVQALLDLVDRKQQEMSCVNLSTALHRLARFAKDGIREVLVADPRFSALRVRALAELERQVSTRTEVLPRCWSTIAWAYATLQLKDQDAVRVMQMIAQLALPHLESLKPFELTNLLWAFAKSQTANAPLFEAAEKHIQQHFAAFSHSSLATLVWVFVTANHHSTSLLRRMSEEFAQGLQNGKEEVQPVEIANLMWGLATAQLYTKPRILREVGAAAVALLQNFKIQELSIMLWAFSRLGVRHDEVFKKAAELLCQFAEHRRQIHPQGMANILWSFQKQASLGSCVVPALTESLRVLLPICEHLMSEFKQKEFSCVLLAVVKLGYSCGDFDSADKVFITAANAKDSYLAKFSLWNCADLLLAFASFVQKCERPPLGIANVMGILARRLLQQSQEFEPASATIILELSTVLVHHSSEIEALIKSAAAAAVCDIEDFQPPALMRLAIATLDLTGDNRKLLTGAIAHRALQIGLNNFSTVDRGRLADMCAISSGESDLFDALQKAACIHQPQANNVHGTGKAKRRPNHQGQKNTAFDTMPMDAYNYSMHKVTEQSDQVEGLIQPFVQDLSPSCAMLLGEWAGLPDCSAPPQDFISQQLFDQQQHQLQQEQQPHEHLEWLQQQQLQQPCNVNAQSFGVLASPAAEPAAVQIHELNIFKEASAMRVKNTFVDAHVDAHEDTEVREMRLKADTFLSAQPLKVSPMHQQYVSPLFEPMHAASTFIDIQSEDAEAQALRLNTNRFYSLNAPHQNPNATEAFDFAGSEVPGLDPLSVQITASSTSDEALPVKAVATGAMAAARLVAFGDQSATLLAQYLTPATSPAFSS
jgi:hypothetical protein